MVGGRHSPRCGLELGCWAVDATYVGGEINKLTRVTDVESRVLSRQRLTYSVVGVVLAWFVTTSSDYIHI